MSGSNRRRSRTKVLLFGFVLVNNPRPHQNLRQIRLEPVQEVNLSLFGVQVYLQLPTILFSLSPTRMLMMNLLLQIRNFQKKKDLWSFFRKIKTIGKK